MKRPIAHIGVHKTGSSSIQIMLNANQHILENNGFYLPTSGWLNGAHHKLCYDMLQFGNFDEERSSLKALTSEIVSPEKAHLTPVLTSEEFERFNEHHVKEFRDIIGTDDCEIVVFLRRQDDYLISDYGQQIKMGANRPKFEKYVQRAVDEPRFNYEQTLNAWSSVFGKDNIKAIVYSDAVKSEGIYKVFLEHSGLPDIDQARWRIPQRNANASWTAQETDFIRRVTGNLRSQYNVDTLNWHATYAEHYPDIKDYCKDVSTKLQVTQEESDFVKERFLASNTAVIEQYNIAGDKSDLLFEPRPLSEPTRYVISDDLVADFSNKIATENRLEPRRDKR